MAATGDVHCSPEREQEVQAALTGVAEAADLLLLAGDLTTYGQPEEAATLARVCAAIPIPCFAVLGNHDWHCDHHDEVVAELSGGGIEVLEARSTCLRAAGQSVGIVGTKGFVGGFAGHSHIDDFGEPAFRELYRATSCEVQALDRGLREIALCDIRIVLLHYSPCADTLVGEPEGIWAFLGSDRLAAPIVEHEPDLVVHGHAHAGTFRGMVGEVPVYNVSMATIQRGYTIFELHARGRASATIH